MPPKKTENYTIGFQIGDGEFQEINAIRTVELVDEPINVYTLEDEPNMFETNGASMELEVSKDILWKANRGEKVYCETSCICDGTFYFAGKLALALKEIGCVCVKVRSEIIDDANPSWMNCKFIASGVMWYTNNWRRMHGLPMISRKMCKNRRKTA